MQTTKVVFILLMLLVLQNPIKLYLSPVRVAKEEVPKPLRLDQLLEHLSHGEVSDENRVLLRDYCATIQKRYEFHPLF